MKCLETRKRKDGLRFRRYRTDDGRTITTFEVPTTVLRAFSMPKVQAQLEAWERGQERQARRVQVEARIRQGIKPTAIAHEFGLTDQRVRQIKKAMQEGKKK